MSTKRPEFPTIQIKARLSGGDQEFHVESELSVIDVQAEMLSMLMEM